MVLAEIKIITRRSMQGIVDSFATRPFLGKWAHKAAGANSLTHVGPQGTLRWLELLAYIYAVGGLDSVGTSCFAPVGR